jgi:hypothetical protein
MECTIAALGKRSLRCATEDGFCFEDMLESWLGAVCGECIYSMREMLGLNYICQNERRGLRLVFAVA